MLRLLVFIVIIAALGLGLSQIMGSADDIIITFGQTRLTTSVATALAGFVVALIIIFILWSLIKKIVTSPIYFHRLLKEQRRERSYQALAQGLIAAFSGDGAQARKFVKKINDSLDKDDRALWQLLEAKTLLLENNKGGAIACYEKMRKDDEGKALALYGLYREALNSGAYEAALDYAEQAVALRPTLQWANQAMLDKLASEGNWHQAIELFERNERALLRAQRTAQLGLKTVIYTGYAIALFSTHPEEARKLALKANKWQPDFIPTANVSAAILYKLHEERKANKLIEKLWSTSAHSDLATTYLLGQGANTAQQRLKRAKILAAKNPTSFQSAMCVAGAAFDAQEFKLARRMVEKAIKIEPYERCFLLLADIEEATSGDQGRVKHYLAQALKAPPDYRWMADGVILAEWRAVAPLSGRLGVVKWMAPAREISNQPLLELDEPKSAEERTLPRNPVSSTKKDANVELKEFKPFIVDAVADDLSEGELPVRERLNVDDPGVRSE